MVFSPRIMPPCAWVVLPLVIATVWLERLQTTKSNDCSKQMILQKPVLWLWQLLLHKSDNQDHLPPLSNQQNIAETACNNFNSKVLPPTKINYRYSWWTTKGVNLMLIFLLPCSFPCIFGWKLEEKCSSALLQLVGEEVTECVAKQQMIAREVGEVFSGEIYRQVRIISLYLSLLTWPIGICMCDDL